MAVDRQHHTSTVERSDRAIGRGDPLEDLAQTLLVLIEHRTRYLVAQTRRAIEMFLTAQGIPWTDSALLEPGQPRGHPGLTLPDLDRYAREWASMVPDDPNVRAALLRRLAHQYALTADAVENVRAALGLDEQAVRDAYERRYGGPLEAIFRSPAALANRIRDQVLPGLLDDDIGRAIEHQMDWVMLSRGELLCRKGDRSDSLYLVVHGRLRAVIEGPNGRERILGEIGPGETVGEMGVVSGLPRSATVRAARDTELLRLSKAGFDHLVGKHPGVVLPISRSVIRRLRDAIDLGGRVGHTVSTIAVVPADPSVPLHGFVCQLVAELARHGSTLHLDRARFDQLVGYSGSGLTGLEADDTLVAGWLNDQEIGHRFVIYEADPRPSTWTKRCVRQADRVLLLARAESSPEVSPFEEAILGEGLERARVEPDLVLLHHDAARVRPGTRRWLEARAVHHHYHVCLRTPGDVARLVRRLTGRAVGLVLGGGGARGFAHIGAIRAIEEFGIPIDLVGGTSAGAIIAGQYALGRDVHTITELSRRLFRAERMLDYTVPLVSFVAARKWTGGLRKLFGDVMIEDLHVKYFCVSANITRAEPVTHEYGPLWLTTRASSSIPGLLPPVLVNDELLVDGAVVDNLPIETMREFCDGGPVIAVDVAPEVEPRRGYRFGHYLRGSQMLMSRLKLSRKPPIVAPSIVEIIYRSASVNSVRTSAAQKRKATVCIEAPVQQFGVLDSRNFDQIVDAGYHAARAALERWTEEGSG